MRSRGIRCAGVAPLAALAWIEGCFPTPAGCNVYLWSEDECNDEGEACVSDSTFRSCLFDPCMTRWVKHECPKQAPHCVQVSTSLGETECVAKPTCAATEACQSAGLCADGPDGCVATAEGCKNACVKAGNGACGFDGKQCVATPQGCRASNDCRQSGACGTLPTSILCVPTADGCAASLLACGGLGWCGFDPANGCVGTAEGCAASSNCAGDGRCGFDGTGCVHTAEGCRQSHSCEQFQLCNLVDGHCAK